MQVFRQFLKRLPVRSPNRYTTGFLIVWIALVLANYSWGTHLMGWDNLQTDLDPWLGVERALVSVWQENQSFGAVAGLAYAADLVRAVFIWILSFVIPQSVLRYLFHGLMLLAGGLGMMHLLKKRIGTNTSEMFALAGGIFYLLNFGIIQIMHLPLEAFSCFIGMLPWAVWIYLEMLDASKLTRKDWVLFLMINICLMPAFFIQTLFIVYGLVLVTLTGGYLIFKKNWVRLLVRACLIGVVVILIQMFWLLPQMYFVSTSTDTVQNAKINALSTDDAFLQNQEKGTLNHLLLMEGNYYDIVAKNNAYIFADWKKHRTNPFVVPLLWIIAGTCVLGFMRKTPLRLPLLALMLLSSVALLSNTPPFSLVNDMIREIGIVNQIFRAPFTKFVFVHALVMAYGFANGLIILSELSYKTNRRIEKVKHLPLSSYKIGVMTLFTTSVLISSLPVFLGHLYSPVVRVPFPEEYNKFFDYMKTAPADARVALLPEYTFWGWSLYNWGYTGSGFVWYGLRQPVISRNFDIWSNESQSYYWELKSALEAEDIQMLENVFQKYRVQYLLFDESLQEIAGSGKTLQADRTIQMLQESEAISRVDWWGSLQLYTFKNNLPANQHVSLAEDLPVVEPQKTILSDDQAYQDLGTYTSSLDDTELDRYYPFLNVTSQTRLSDKDWQISENDNTFFLSAPLPERTDTLSVQTATDEASFSYLRRGEIRTRTMEIETETRNNSIRVRIPKLRAYDLDLRSTTLANCFREGKVTLNEKSRYAVDFTTEGGATGCFNYYLQSIEQRYGYLVRIRHETQYGRPLLFYLLDVTKIQPYIEDRLVNDTEFLFVRPRFESGIGYTFTFQNNSYEQYPSRNILKDVDVFYFPYDEVQQIYLEDKTTSVDNVSYSTPQAQKKNSYTYTVALDTSDTRSKDQTLILWQAYNPGWEAYQVPSESWFHQAVPFISGSLIPTHREVNNWANGWRLDVSTLDVRTWSSESNSNNQPLKSNILIIFWPQYLQYIGVLITLATIAIILLNAPQQIRTLLNYTPFRFTPLSTRHRIHK